MIAVSQVLAHFTSGKTLILDDFGFLQIIWLVKQNPTLVDDFEGVDDPKSETLRRIGMVKNILH